MWDVTVVNRGYVTGRITDHAAGHYDTEDWSGTFSFKIRIRSLNGKPLELHTEQLTDYHDHYTIGTRYYVTPHYGDILNIEIEQEWDIYQPPYINVYGPPYPAKHEKTEKPLVYNFIFDYGKRYYGARFGEYVSGTGIGNYPIIDAHFRIPLRYTSNPFDSSGDWCVTYKDGTEEESALLIIGANGTCRDYESRPDIVAHWNMEA
jgi:hypothetical protein